MNTALPYLVMLLVLGALLVFSTRNRRRQVAEQMVRLQRLRPGDEVMTTSGLYGTVVSRNDDNETVQLAIAPGVEVRWALAALRDVESLSDRYGRALRDGEDGTGAGDDGEPGGAGPVGLGKP